MTRHQINWERLRVLGLEIEEERRDAILEAHERLQDGDSVRWGSLIERYVKLQTRVHLYVKLRHPDGVADARRDLHTRQLYCGSFKWPESTAPKDLDLEFLSELGENLKQLNVGKRTNDVNGAVLVSV